MTSNAEKLKDAKEGTKMNKENNEKTKHVVSMPPCC